MCGIFGCVGSEDAAKKVYGGLKKLEYRGYDSAGISSVCVGVIHTFKRAGRVSGIERGLNALKGSAAIGHTRWATHGAPEDRNAHPHAAGKFSVVHNGIIENYAELKTELVNSGAVFLSDTDSEVIAHLLNFYYKGDFMSAVHKTVKRLKGSFALCILCADISGVIAVRQRNPIIIGRGKGCMYASSDMPALAGVAKEAYVLKDGQIAFLTADGARLYDFDLNNVKFKYSPVTVKASDCEKSGWDHFMIKEINEVPAAIYNTLSAYDNICTSALNRIYSGVNRVILTGCGTAYHSALTGENVLLKELGINARAVVASELRYGGCKADKNTLLIAVSQSGETADTVEAARLFKEQGGRVLAVTNVEGSALNALADGVAPVRAGTEVCVAATKSYCGQLAALVKIAQVWGADVKELECIAALCKQLLKCADVRALASFCAKARGVYFIGRGIDYPVALEGSLKLKEVSYVAGEGYPAGELKHGTLALIDKDTLTVAIVTEGALAKKTAASLEQVRSRGGKTAVIASKSILPLLKGGADICVQIPDCGRFLSPLLAAIPLQLLAYHTAVILGRDPDKPRNLAKSVTVE